LLCLPNLEILFRGLQAGVDQIHVRLRRGYAAFGLPLEAVQDIDPAGELDGVDGPVGVALVVLDPPGEFFRVGI
jgi:hypothetical protein